MKGSASGHDVRTVSKNPEAVHAIDAAFCDGPVLAVQMRWRSLPPFQMFVEVRVLLK
jgi:hypothetical protein